MRVCPRCCATYAAETAFCGLDGERLVEQESDPLIGKTLDRYSIEARLGTGAMGAVYRAQHTVLGREHAVKVLFGDFASDNRLVARFRREAQAASQIQHENIVSVMDFGTAESGLTFLVMELVEGHTLAKEIESGPLPPRRAGRIARQVALGLAAAHELGFVHRDLKPANIMLAGSGASESAKILDFGVVGAIDRDDEATKLTRTGTIVGTPLYMAPEQAQGDPATPASDLYSLGVILFEMLAGRPPFQAKSLQKVVMKHLTAPPPPLPPCAGLERLVPALLQKHPSRRPNRAEQVVQEIDRILESAGDQAALSLDVLNAVIADGLGQLPGSDPVSPDALTKELRPKDSATREPVRVVLDTDPPPPHSTAGRLLEQTRTAPPDLAVLDRPPLPRVVTPVPAWTPPPPEGARAFSAKSTDPGEVADSFADLAIDPRAARRRGQRTALLLTLAGALAIGYVWLRRVPEAPQDGVTTRPPQTASARGTQSGPKGAAGARGRRPAGSEEKAAGGEAERAAQVEAERKELEMLERQLRRMLVLRGLSESDLGGIEATRPLLESWRRGGAPKAAQDTVLKLIDLVRSAEVESDLLRRRVAALEEAIRGAAKLSPETRSSLDQRRRELERAVKGGLEDEGKRRTVAFALARLQNDLEQARE